MKGTKRAFLAMLCLSFVGTAAACGGGGGGSKDEGLSKTKKTESEFIEAIMATVASDNLTMNAVDSFANQKTEATMKIDGDEWNYYEKFYLDGKLEASYESYVEFNDDVIRMYDYEDGEWSVTEIPTMMEEAVKAELAYTLNMMTAFTDFYSSFTFNEETGAYTATNLVLSNGEEETTLASATIYFTDSYLYKVETVDDEQYHFEMTFSDYGDTKVKLPSLEDEKPQDSGNQGGGEGGDAVNPEVPEDMPEYGEGSSVNSEEWDNAFSVLASNVKNVTAVTSMENWFTGADEPNLITMIDKQTETAYYKSIIGVGGSQVMLFVEEDGKTYSYQNEGGVWTKTDASDMTVGEYAAMMGLDCSWCIGIFDQMTFDSAAGVYHGENIPITEMGVSTTLHNLSVKLVDGKVVEISYESDILRYESGSDTPVVSGRATATRTYYNYGTTEIEIPEVGSSGGNQGGDITVTPEMPEVPEYGEGMNVDRVAWDMAFGKLIGATNVTLANAMTVQYFDSEKPVEMQYLMQITDKVLYNYMASANSVNGSYLAEIDGVTYVYDGSDGVWKRYETEASIAGQTAEMQMTHAALAGLYDQLEFDAQKGVYYAENLTIDVDGEQENLYYVSVKIVDGMVVEIQIDSDVKRSKTNSETGEWETSVVGRSFNVMTYYDYGTTTVTLPAVGSSSGFGGGSSLGGGSSSGGNMSDSESSGNQGSIGQTMIGEQAWNEIWARSMSYQNVQAEGMVEDNEGTSKISYTCADQKMHYVEQGANNVEEYVANVNGEDLYIARNDDGEWEAKVYGGTFTYTNDILRQMSGEFICENYSAFRMEGSNRFYADRIGDEDSAVFYNVTVEIENGMIVRLSYEMQSGNMKARVEFRFEYDNAKVELPNYTVVETIKK